MQAGPLLQFRCGESPQVHVMEVTEGEMIEGEILRGRILVGNLWAIEGACLGRESWHLGMSSQQKQVIIKACVCPLSLSVY